MPELTPLVRGLQERAARAFPAVHVERVDGWWLRRAGGAAWWASSVLPHGDAGPDELPGRIRYAERFAAGYRMPTRFQISPGACPAGLDRALGGLRYRVESPMSLQSASTVDVLGRLAAGDVAVRVDDRPADGWFETWFAVHGGGAEQDPERAMLHRVDRPSGYACAVAGGRVVAVGRAVADTGWAGVFGMATLPQARGAGAAGQVLAALARWAARHGAARLYLQVECGNEPAHRLYRRAGFTELCRYHYRTSTSGTFSADAIGGRE